MAARLAEEGGSNDPKAALLGLALTLVEESFIASSGPGGQNVNKVASAVQLRINVYKLRLSPPVFHRLKALAGSKMNLKGDIVLTARTWRTQEANRAEARARLVTMLEQALIEPEKRKKSQLNRLGKQARLGAKKNRGAVKAARGKPSASDW